MIDYSIYYNLPRDIKKELLNLNLDFVFQPIFARDNSIFAYEALMRPAGETVGELIDRYADLDKLHIIEVATILGALQEYKKRKYDGLLHINSFPSEYLSDDELSTVIESYPELQPKVVIEVLEYLKGSEHKWEKKKPIFEHNNMITAIDDFGAGENGVEAVDFYKPNIVKFDRSLISDISTNPIKQAIVKDNVRNLHSQEYYLVAEGVETKDEYDYLKAAGFDFFQGFYLGMPK